MANNKRRKLKASSDYGQISPPFNGAVYHQDGVFFDARGLEIFTDADSTDEKRHAAIGKWQEAEDRAANMRASLAAKKSDQTENPTGEEDEDATDIDDEDAENSSDGDGDGDDEHAPPALPQDHDLRKWVRGEQKLPWFTVRKLVSEKYHFDATNKLAAVQKLIEVGLVSPEEVKV